MTDADLELYERAVAVAGHAYAPYSSFAVGAAARALDGRIVEGVNVENAAYPLGICAERSALAAAVAAGYKPGDLDSLAVTAAPCGACRQWLLELEVRRVIYGRRDGSTVVCSPVDLPPDRLEV